MPIVTTFLIVFCFFSLTLGVDQGSYVINNQDGVVIVVNAPSDGNSSAVISPNFTIILDQSDDDESDLKENKEDVEEEEENEEEITFVEESVGEATEEWLGRVLYSVHSSADEDCLFDESCIHNVHFCHNDGCCYLKECDDDGFCNLSIFC